jgi:hypothetical protein
MRALLVIRRENGPRDRLLFLRILHDVRGRPGSTPSPLPSAPSSTATRKAASTTARHGPAPNRHPPPHGPAPLRLQLQKESRCIESLFCRLRDWRRIATRYDRCADLFLSACCLSAVVLCWL